MHRLFMFIGIILTVGNVHAANDCPVNIPFDFNNDGIDEQVVVNPCYSGIIPNGGKFSVITQSDDSMTDLEVYGMNAEQELGYKTRAISNVFVVFSHDCQYYVRYNYQYHDLRMTNSCN